jgi:hypothetical protein
MLTTHEISARSIDLVEQRLLADGIGPFVRSSDRRVHLILRASQSPESKIQIKGNAKPKPAGGKGKLALDWKVGEDSPADVIALVDLSTERIWLMSFDELAELAQQHASGRYHLYMYVDHAAVLRRGNYDTDFDNHLLERKTSRLFVK